MRRFWELGCDVESGAHTENMHISFVFENSQDSKNPHGKTLFVFTEPAPKEFLKQHHITTKPVTINGAAIEDLEVLLKAVRSADYVTRNPHDTRLSRTFSPSKAVKWAVELWQGNVDMRSVPQVIFTMKPNGALSENFAGWYKAVSGEAKPIKNITDIPDVAFQTLLSHIDAHENTSATESLDIGGVDFVLKVRDVEELVEVTMAPKDPLTSGERKRFQKIATAA